MLETAKNEHSRAIEGITKLQAQMTFQFSILSKLLDRQMADIAAGFGLSLIGYRVLVTIEAFGKISAADVARYTGYDKAAISRAVVDLDKQKLVNITLDPDHGRRKLLALTDAGRRKIDETAPMVAGRRDELSAQLTQTEERVFLRVIEKLAAHVASDIETAKRRAA